MTRINIAEGINLNIIQTDKFKTNLLKINFTLPLTLQNAPLASLLPQVLRRGCKQYPTMLALNRQLEYLYATKLSGGSGKCGENQTVSFRASFLRNELIPDKTDLISAVCDILTACVFSPFLENGVFSAEYVESEKKNLCDIIESEINNKQAYAHKRMIDIMCQGEAYAVSHLGTVESVSAITAQALTDFYFGEFSKAPIEIFFVGVCNEDSLILQIKEKFSAHSQRIANYAQSSVNPNVAKIKRVTEEMPVNQGKLSMGFRTGSCIKNKNTEIFSVFNTIFGASPSSKLFENVREKLSLCYYCSSGFEASTGLMYISSGVKVGDETSAEEEILRQLDAMKNGEFSENDITVAKKSIENNYLGCYDDADRIVSWYLNRIISGAENLTVEQVVEKIKKVSKEEIIAIANTVKLDTVYFLKGTNEAEATDEEQGEIL